MKKTAILLLILIFARLSFWKNKQTQSWNLCSQIASEEGKSAIKELRSVSGSLILTPKGDWSLQSPRIGLEGGDAPFYGEVLVNAPSAAFSAALAKIITVTGGFHCGFGFQNFAVFEDPYSNYGFPKLAVDKRGMQVRVNLLDSSSYSRFSIAFVSFFDRAFERTPGLLAFVKAVWTGATLGLPESMLKVYREGGLLQILALSGQHVNALLLLCHLTLSVFAKLFLRFRLFRQSYSRCLLLLPLLCSLLLAFTSNGAPSVMRTVGMALALLILRLRRFSSPIFQLLGSSVACLLIWDPGLISGASFCLSVGSTFLLIRLGQQNKVKQALIEYLLLSTLMPVLVLPFTAFYFGKISLSAPFNTLLVAWLWDLFLIPLGFLLPLCIFLPAVLRHGILEFLERTWVHFVQLHERVGALIATTYVAVPRLTVLELCVVQVFVVAICVSLGAWVGRILLGVTYDARGFDFFSRKVSNR